MAQIAPVMLDSLSPPAPSEAPAVTPAVAAAVSTIVVRCVVIRPPETVAINVAYVPHALDIRLIIKREIVHRHSRCVAHAKRTANCCRGEYHFQF
jgi:hypothetical protein